MDSMDVLDEDSPKSYRKFMIEQNGVAAKRALLGYGFWRRKGQMYEEEMLERLSLSFDKEDAGLLLEGLKGRGIPLPHERVLRAIPLIISSRMLNTGVYEVYVKKIRELR